MGFGASSSVSRVVGLRLRFWGFLFGCGVKSLPGDVVFGVALAAAPSKIMRQTDEQHDVTL